MLPFGLNSRTSNVLYILPKYAGWRPLPPYHAPGLAWPSGGPAVCVLFGFSNIFYTVYSSNNSRPQLRTSTQAIRITLRPDPVAQLAPPTSRIDRSTMPLTHVEYQRKSRHRLLPELGHRVNHQVSGWMSADCM